MGFPNVPQRASALIQSLAEVQRADPDVRARQAQIEADRLAHGE